MLAVVFVLIPSRSCQVPLVVKNRKNDQGSREKERKNWIKSKTCMFSIDIASSMIQTNFQRLRQLGQQSPILPPPGRDGYQPLGNTMTSRPVMDRDCPSRTAAFCDFSLSKIEIQAWFGVFFCFFFPVCTGCNIDVVYLFSYMLLLVVH